MLVTDEDGNVEGDRYSFDPFGRRRNGDDWTDTLTNLANPDTTMGYAGHESLDDVDIVHMNGRIYDPFLGRVLSADPLVPAPHDMQNFNRYSYVFNNPLSLTDPSGFLASGGWYTFGGGWQVTSTFYPGGVTVSARWVEGRSYYVGPSGRGRGRQTGRNTGSGGGGGYSGVQAQVAPVNEEQSNRNVMGQQQNRGQATSPRERNTEEKIGELIARIGNTLVVDAWTDIRIEPWSLTIGADLFAYTVDYHYYDQMGNVVPNIPDEPAFYLNAITGQGGGWPDVLLNVQAPQGFNYDTSRIRWTIHIPPQMVTHQNSAGWNITVYSLPVSDSESGN